METRTVQLEETTLSYTLRKSARARRMWLSVSHRGQIVLTLPRRWNEVLADRFVRDKATWLQKHLTHFKQYVPVPEKILREQYQQHKERARELADGKLVYFNTHYQLSYGKISIRNQKRRWGSCSPENNLSFNYRIALLPQELADYVIVHELCHTAEHNHRRNFWNLVAKTVPNYKDCIRQLRTRYRIGFF